jgi:hypothetical protein
MRDESAAAGPIEIEATDNVFPPINVLQNGK